MRILTAISAVILAVILAIILAAPAALAQDAAKSAYGPVVAAKSKARSNAKTAAKRTASRKRNSKARTTRAKSGKAVDPAVTGSIPTKTPAATADLREAYAAIPLAERIALQSNLIWTGDYNGLIDGAFSTRLVEAVEAYQKRHKDKVTGVPSAATRAALAASARPKQEEVGWQLVEDPVTGARVGLPGKIATRTARAPLGTRWSSAQGQLQIETFQIDTGATLDAVFEQQKRLSKRRVTSSTLRPDYFVISGTQGLKIFHVRAFAQGDKVRGLTILYDQAMEGTMEPVVVAMSSAFVPFTSYTVAGAGAIEISRRKVEYGSGLIVSAVGHIVTARQTVERCQVITVPTLGNAELVAEDKNNGLALLRVYGARALKPAGLSGVAGGGDQVTLIGIADPQAQGGGDAISVVPAKPVPSGNTTTLEPTPALGFSGAAALDGEGRIVGIALQKLAVVAGLSGLPQATLAPLGKLRAFLEANGVTPTTGQPGTDAVKTATVRTICVRK
jgi:peptidoglycan hydrolase-like protein with peptidoglycan-binding domain